MTQMTKPHTVRVRLSEDEYRFLEQEAMRLTNSLRKELGDTVEITKSDVIRRMMEAYRGNLARRASRS